MDVSNKPVVKPRRGWYPEGEEGNKQYVEARRKYVEALFAEDGFVRREPETPSTVEIRSRILESLGPEIEANREYWRQEAATAKMEEEEYAAENSAPSENLPEQNFDSERTKNFLSTAGKAATDTLGAVKEQLEAKVDKPVDGGGYKRRKYTKKKSKRSYKKKKTKKRVKKSKKNKRKKKTRRNRY